MSRKSSVPWRNKSPTGWWIVGEVQAWVPSKSRRASRRSKSHVWENLRLIRAKDREGAYRKAVRLGRDGDSAETDNGVWRFAGISLLLPVYEKIEDGAEVLWTDRGKMSANSLRKLAKSKRQLPVFNDRN